MPCSPYRDTITESGGTELGVDAIADGEVLKRVGTEVVGVTIAAPPIGGMTMWPGLSGTIPSGWLLCNGTAIDPALYPSLAAIITTRFNTGGEPPGWIRVPDLRSCFPYGAPTDIDVGTTGGTSTHSHTNVATSTGITATIVNNAQRQVAAVGNNTSAAQAVGVVDPGHTHVNVAASSLPPFMYFHWIIRAT